MKVTLLNYTSEPDKMIAAAARLCYSNVQDVDTLMSGLTVDKVDSFIDKMSELKNHGTPWEHPSFTFAIEGVSRVLTHQLVRHRIASFDQQSQRYCEGKNFTFVTPPSIAKNPELLEKFENFMQESQDMYKEFTEAGIPKEDARFLFTNACSTRIIMTMNVRSLFHFFALRSCTRAQWEIRELSDQILKICKTIAPKVFQNAGASCVQLGYCPEGHMSCGRAPTLEELLTVYKDRT